MKDFTKWAESSAPNGDILWPIFLCCVAGLLIVGMVCFLLMDALEGVFEFVFGVLLAGAFLVAMLGLAVAGQEESSTEAEDKSSDTAIFTVQVEKEFGVRNLSCPAKVMDATSDLPDAGTYRCTVSDGRDDSALKDVTLIVTADNKVGLYDNQGNEMIDMSEWANGSHNSFGDAIYMATLSTVLVFAVLGVVWRAGRRLALRATHRIPRDAQPLLEDTKFVMCLALVGGFGLLLTLNPGLLVLPKDTTFTEQVARQAGLEALSCPTILDSKYMPGQGRYECEYVDAKGKAHDMSLLVASGDKVWLYDHNGKPMKVEKK